MWGASGKFHRSVRRENIACLLPVRLSTYVGSIKTNVWFFCTHNDPPTWNSACPVRSAFQSNWIVSRQNRFYFIQQANLAAFCAHFWTKFSLLWRCCATWQHRFCTHRSWKLDYTLERKTTTGSTKENSPVLEFSKHWSIPEYQSCFDSFPHSSSNHLLSWIST